MMKCLKILCVFFWVTTWHIWELCYITKPQRIIMSIGFVINQFYQLWLFVSLKSLCQIREDWKQRRLADDCVHKISFWSRNVVTRQWRKPIREELTTYLNFPDHTGWEARRRMRRDRDREEEEGRVILTPVEEEEDIENNVIWGHQRGGGTAATLTTKIWKKVLRAKSIFWLQLRHFNYRWCCCQPGYEVYTSAPRENRCTTELWLPGPGGSWQGGVSPHWPGEFWSL